LCLILAAFGHPVSLEGQDVMAGSKTGAGTSKAGAAKKAAAKKSESAKAAAKRSESKGAKGAKRRAGAGADPAAADAGAPSRPVETGEGPGSPQTLARTVPVRAGEQPWTPRKTCRGSSGMPATGPVTTRPMPAPRPTSGSRRSRWPTSLATSWNRTATRWSAWTKAATACARTAASRSASFDFKRLPVRPYAGHARRRPSAL
jgi:hypothetical protein